MNRFHWRFSFSIHERLEKNANYVVREGRKVFQWSMHAECINYWL